MELDQRKATILDAIIQTYLNTGEPVGSRTISKFTDLHLSSATIRNEMSDLEEMGYIIQPHTSAGRIPTDKGYRLYVDHLKKESQSKEAQADAVHSLMIARTNRMEDMLKKVVQYLAANTNYTTMISAPTYKRNKVKFIQLSRLSPVQLLNVVVIDGNVVKNHIIDLQEEITEDQVLKLNLLLNTRLNGLTLGEINLGLISNMKEEAGFHTEIINAVLDTIAEVIRAETDENMEIYTSGANNIFKYPELSDSESASRLISTLEQKEGLIDLVKDTEQNQMDGDDEIQVYIGNENSVDSMKDCSVVTASYDLGDGMQGTIGIIGPKRMDYEKVMSNLKTMKISLTDAFKKPAIPDTQNNEESEG